jgi:gamma-glutamyltranspeptidase/glutathione hydrolase
MRGAVASGHPLTSRAAIEMFRKGGNAFDAALAAGFTSAVSEPSLTSLGGGGFLLAHDEKQKKDILFDFFVNTPGLGHRSRAIPRMTPVEIKFPACTQVFHTGFASPAVPGVLKGFLHIHSRMCTLPLKTILAPALGHLDDGVPINGRQAIFLGLLEPIFTSSDYGREIFIHKGRYVKEGDRIFNPLLKGFYQALGEEGRDFYNKDRARTLADEMQKQGCLVTAEDLGSYRVVEREPLRIGYRGNEVLTNPPPALGGIKLALSLFLLDKINLAQRSSASVEFIVTLAEVMKEMYHFTPLKKGRLLPYPFEDKTINPLLESFRKNLADKNFTSTQGTTQISVIDEEGNAVSMTTSNGSGSGCFIPGTGIMLNNMMGEDDLHPDGFFSSPAGQRVSSMMLPTMVLKDGKVDCVMGSGGSKRIRTAILQTIVNTVDFSLPLKEAIEKPRIHFEDDVVHVEPEIPDEMVSHLKKNYTVNLWHNKDMYFGGVHCVRGNMDGWGDSRRGGSYMCSSD